MANLSSRVWTIWRRMIVKSCKPTGTIFAMSFCLMTHRRHPLIS